MCRLSDGIPRAFKCAVADGIDEFPAKERKVYFLDRESFTGYLETQHAEVAGASPSRRKEKRRSL